MEIGISKKGDLRVLALKGNLRLQHWRVIDKHLEAMLVSGARRVALDLSGVTLLEESGIATLLKGTRKFRDRESELLLVAGGPSIREALRVSGRMADLDGCLFADWTAVAALPPPPPSEPPLTLS
jgi:anti-anti-sigma regulatory factor